MAGRSHSPSRSAPWWLGGGEEECPHCGLPYAAEAELRCPDCDAPSCMHCLVEHEDRKVCPDCVPAPRAASGGRSG